MAGLAHVPMPVETAAQSSAHPDKEAPQRDPVLNNDGGQNGTFD